ncbi:LIM domain-containing protein 1 isoform X1 [Notothenia coriiceps]|uniref:LIM domain-containing protein 1 isoform X1 n=1 Tax=Notothenia coriiceps TaxID=8208 RepID=A0A6I9NS28_9TELE|nr:PREDICTED: LIM domain-containing protein 1-like isoform X1 [Notothenia coriiceps]
MDPSFSPSLYFGSCTGCGKAVYGEGRACRAMGHLFHDTCFTCCVCSEKLTGKPFYTVSGRIYCVKDFMYPGVHPSSEVCNSCGFLLMDMVLQARGKSYHPSCFCCVVCRQSLEGQQFTVDAESRVYCVSDYHKVKAPLCAACREPILPTEGSQGSIRVVSFDRNYHPECYRGEVNLI